MNFGASILGLHEVPYWSTYSKTRMLIYTVTASKYFDLAIAGVIGLNVITMALEFYLMPKVCRFPPLLSSRLDV